jgi:CheY-like chemotaxis protein
VEHELQILIIEDDPADALRLMHELGRNGIPFRGRRVETREDFLNAVNRHRPDVVLSDHGLPSFSGFAALDIIREQFPEVPFIFVTGYYDQGMMVEMFESGAAGYVYKNRLSELVPAIKQALKETPAAGRPAESAPLKSPPQAKPDSKTPEVRARRQPVLICSHSKSVRDHRGEWAPLVDYLRQQEQATVTLGLCPECAELGSLE